MNRKYVWFVAVAVCVCALFVLSANVLMGSEVYVPVYNSSGESLGGGEISFGILSSNESVLNDSETNDVYEE
jgi:hypothetical protein